MMRARFVTVVALICLAWAAQAIGEDAPSTTATEIFKRKIGSSSEDLSSYLIDNAASTVSAAGLLGISGESITAVENVRDFSVALKGLGTGDSKTVLAISLAPARTSFTPMSYTTYANNPWARVIGALSFGYAQGDTTISSQDYHRQAISLETSYYINKKDDPIIRYHEAVDDAANGRGKVDANCLILLPAKPLAKSSPLPPAAPNTPVPVNSDGDDGPSKPHEVSGEDEKARAKACRENLETTARWNTSRVSLAFAGGWIKPTDESHKQESLGKTTALGLVYGFDGLDLLHDNSALTLTLRRTIKEPVLDTLQSASITTKNTSLAALRFTIGTNGLRGLVEVSNARSDQITPSQRTFKEAVGFDISLNKLAPTTWLNFRLGRQRKIDGTGDETGGFLSLSMSPNALLKF
jgi:hypothetical protein